MGKVKAEMMRQQEEDMHWSVLEMEADIDAEQIALSIWDKEVRIQNNVLEALDVIGISGVMEIVVSYTEKELEELEDGLR